MFDRTRRFWGGEGFFVYHYTDRCLLLSNFSTSGLACGLMVSLPACTYKFAGLIPTALTDDASIHLTTYLNMPVLPTPEKACLFRHVCYSRNEHSFQNNTVIPRLTKIIRSGITFVSRNVVLWGVSLLVVSNVNNPVGLVGLPYVMWLAHFFVIHIQTEKISSWNGPTVHVCCFMLARASTKTFVSRILIR